MFSLWICADHCRHLTPSIDLEVFEYAIICFAHQCSHRAIRDYRFSTKSILKFYDSMLLLHVYFDSFIVCFDYITILYYLLIFHDIVILTGRPLVIVRLQNNAIFCLVISFNVLYSSIRFIFTFFYRDKLLNSVWNVLHETHREHESITVQMNGTSKYLNKERKYTKGKQKQCSSVK